MSEIEHNDLTHSLVTILVLIRDHPKTLKVEPCDPPAALWAVYAVGQYETEKKIQESHHRYK
jgi:hypothetical protein